MSTLLYNPDRKNKQQFIEEFVVRTKIFDEIFKDLKETDVKYPGQNYLLIGQRGLGKTTLLTRLKYAVEDDADLQKWLIPVSFSEEQYSIGELANVWEYVAQYLEDYHGFKGLYDEMELHVSKSNFEQLAFDILIRHLDKHNKKVVLLIDNIGTLLSKFEELEVRRLREILQTRSHIRLIAGSTTSLESIADYHQPLYEFFKVIQLKGLTNEESKVLLKKLAEVYNESEKIERIIAERPGRVETIRTLSGGVPRTIAMLFQVFIDNEHGSSISDLEKILDLVTPLYKHRMDDLPTQQQKIVHAVALNWDAVTVKELAERLRLDSKLISAQLRQLEKNQVIEKRTTKTKNHLYLLSERFFNIWYLMRYGRKENRQRVIWLVRFLEVWCDEKEIEKRINNYITKYRAGLLDEKTSQIFGEVYSYFERINSNTKFLLKEATPKYISKQISISEVDIENLINLAIEAKDWERLIKIGLNNKLNTIQKQNVFSLLRTDYSFGNLFDKYFNEYFNKLDKSARITDEVITVPSFFLTGCMTESVDYVIFFLKNKQQESIGKSVKYYINIYKMAKSLYDSEYEQGLFDELIFSLLKYKMYNIALNTFDALIKIDTNIIDKHKVFYHSTLRLLNKGENEIAKINDEILEKINITSNFLLERNELDHSSE